VQDEPPAESYATRPTRKRAPSPLASWLIGAGVVGVLAWLVLTPRLHGTREMMPRAQCASNLRGIGQGLKAYAADNGDAFPPSLETLIHEGLCARLQFVSPLSKHKEPACDYYYVTGLTNNDPDDWILAYADQAYINGQGANLLYLDGHVDFVREPGFTQELDRFKTAYERARGIPPVIIPPH
jgi:prepilin-type processing-associated H-X9-DG protein